MGIPSNINGYLYLIEAIKIAFNDKQAVLNMSKNIYEPLAEKFCTTAKRVSSGVTRAIDIGWDRCELGTLEKYFGSNAFNTTRFPSNSEYITVLAENVRAVCERVDAEPTITEQVAARDPEAIKKMAENALQEMGVPTHLNGYQYLVDAISLAADDIDLVNALYRVLYPVVAQHFDTTPDRVANAMRYAIEASWDLGDLDVLKRWFGYTINPCMGKPTNGELIALVADTIQRKMNCFD